MLQLDIALKEGMLQGSLFLINSKLITVLGILKLKKYSVKKQPIFACTKC